MTQIPEPLGRILGRVLLRIEDERRGSLLVDTALGFLSEIRFSDGSRLELHDVDLRPQPDELFVRP